MNTLTVAVVTWNPDKQQIKKTINSIQKSIEFAEKENVIGISHTFIFDNNSDDTQLIESLQSEKVTVIFNESNLGFAEGNNLLLDYCATGWILLINPDVELTYNAICIALKSAIENFEFDVFGMTLISSLNNSKVDGLGDIVHGSGLCWRDGHQQNSRVTRQLTQPYETFAVCAAALLMRRQTFADANGFDTDFFCYQEDIDLAFRLRLAGSRALQVPQAIALHVGSQSTGGYRSDFSVYHGRRNHVWCYVKNMPGVLFWLFLPLHLLLNVVDLVYFSLHAQAGVIWRAKWDAIKGLPKMWRKRQVIQTQRVASIGQIWRALDKRLWPFNFKAIRASIGRRFE